MAENRRRRRRRQRPRRGLCYRLRHFVSHHAAAATHALPAPPTRFPHRLPPHPPTPSTATRGAPSPPPNAHLRVGRRYRWRGRRGWRASVQWRGRRQWHAMASTACAARGGAGISVRACSARPSMAESRRRRRQRPCRDDVSDVSDVSDVTVVGWRTVRMHRPTSGDVGDAATRA